MIDIVLLRGGEERIGETIEHTYFKHGTLVCFRHAMRQKTGNRCSRER